MVNDASRGRGASFTTRVRCAEHRFCGAIGDPLRLPDADVRVLLQRTDDKRVSRERMHLDLETDHLEVQVRRLEALGASRWEHHQERGYDFWVLRDPWGNEFRVLQPISPTYFPCVARGPNW